MIKTFSDFDKYGLEQFADKLTTYLQIESQFVDESFVLSLNSEFGSGKSTFFEMWANKLKSDGNMFEVVHINAWESDYLGDPLLAIVLCLMEHLQLANEADETKQKIKETAGKLGKFSLSIGNDVVQRVTGIDFIKAGQYAESEDGVARPNPGEACFQLYKERCKLFGELKEEICAFIAKSELPILIIIDELDRCRPNYAVEFLETIKHFFDMHGLIFVIGVDKSQLASSAKALFGQDLVFDEYYRKFAHRNTSLPVKTQVATEGFCRKVAEEYLGQEAFNKKKRFSYIKNKSDLLEKVVELCVAFSLNARQMHELFRISAHVFSVSEKPKSNLLWGFEIGTFFMVGLSIKNRDFYNRIGNGAVSLSEFTEYLIEFKLCNNENVYSVLWWPAVLYLGVFNNMSLETLEKEFKAIGVWESSGKEGITFQQALQPYSSAYSDFGRMKSNPPFITIYNILEELRTFAK